MPLPYSCGESTPSWLVSVSFQMLGGAETLLALVNVEEERVLREQLPERVFLNGNHVLLEPHVKLNLHLIFAARHSKYQHALHYLSHVLKYFQAHPSFTPDEYPGLHPSIEKLNVELLSYGTEQLNHVWAYIGAKYLPSAIYRVRMVILQDSAPRGIGKPISELEMVPREK